MKKKVSILCVIAFVFLMAGCRPGFYDDSYDDTSFLAGEDKCNVKLFSGLMVGTDQYQFTVENITGATTIWSYTAETAGEEVSLGVGLSEPEGGMVKFVLVNPLGEVETMIEPVSSNIIDTYSFETIEGTYLIKLVGKGSVRVKGHLIYNQGEIRISD